MVLAGASIWIGHFRVRNPRLADLLESGQTAMHDHVLGELALGSLRNRETTLEDLANLPRAPVATEEEARRFIESRRLFARGIGYTDAHLLASVMLDGAMKLWTSDTRLATAADELGAAFQQS